MCWDDCDILHEKPTGAVRVSFGYMSIFEDSMATHGLGVVVSYALAKEGYYVVLEVATTFRNCLGLSRGKEKNLVKMMSTNYIGPFCLTKLLLLLLEQSSIPSRVISVTSFTYQSVLNLMKISEFQTVTELTVSDSPEF
ncbi:hypothetical protein FXO38_31818 [Capsicum annuum]|nr:hypothetical protein FXO38_31818 [Capsicum annuum]KAF3645605.1 hypothetical protein FXO37_20873 [Capsicum annuum]